ncbi:MAG: hypothetical protein Q8942_17705 [Bacillota bacterium]|nr:hypothetical protein [Bacillota bacterium]
MHKDCCPTNDILIKYLSNNLEQNIVDKIDEHMLDCDLCVAKYRKMSEMMDTLNDIKSYKHDLNETVYCDIILFPAAESEDMRGISEIISQNNKFKLKLIPFLNDNRYILEVELLDERTDGMLIIENKDGILLKSEIINGFASEEFNSQFDFREIVITFEKNTL